MKQITNNKGFTLIEIIVAITLLSVLLGTMVSKYNFTTNLANGISAQIITAISEIEISFGNYNNDKNTAPTGLTDATFVPTYLMIPAIPTGFDSSYGTGGFILAQQTAQASPNNGWYIATRVNVTGPTDQKWLGIVNAASQMPTTKFFYNTTAPALSNMAAPAGAATVIITSWITRY